jgi:hypothetical protein
VKAGVLDDVACLGLAGTMAPAAAAGGPAPGRQTAGTPTPAPASPVMAARPGRRLARKRKLAVVASVTARDGAGREATSTHAYTLLAPRR